MATAISKTLEALAQIDTSLEQHVKVPFSLCPDKIKITSLYQLGMQLLHPHLSTDFLVTFVETLRQVILSQIEHFPENIFWDFDYLFTNFLAKDSCQKLLDFGNRLIMLQAAYGIHSPIRFQYMHDFSFGFDWARWIAKNPKDRSHIGLYDDSFLDYLMQRSQELLLLIDKDDAKYQKLPTCQARNPYGFPRSPTYESRILKTLAAQGMIPVPAWQTHAKTQWQNDFTKIREDIALALQAEVLRN